MRRLHPLLILSLALPIATRAQQSQPVTKPAAATAVGVAYDSVRLKPIVGAVVRVDSSALTAMTDEEGRFRIEGLPPGTHFLKVDYPMLDTLGVTLRSRNENYSAGETRATAMVIPSSETLISQLCAPAWRARGPAALMGRVREADSGNAASGAKVSLVWYELDTKGGLKRIPRVREMTVGSDGVYRLCGLPEKLDAKLQVISGDLSSGDIAVDFGGDLLALRSMTIAAPNAVIAVQHAADTSSVGGAPARTTLIGTARLTGKVINKIGAPVVGARVQVDGTTRVAITRVTGDFILDSLPPGTQTVTVRLLGYAPTEAAVDLASRATRSVTIRMEDFVPVLAEVRVNAQRERALDIVGFARRKRVGAGYYMDDKDINHNALNFSDVIRSAPMVRITSVGHRQMIQSSRDPMGGCVNIYIDGSKWQQLEPGDVDDFVKPWELGAIEVYSPTTVPAEYQSPGSASCTTIIAWTYRRLDRKR